MEAIFIEYAILEDRLESILRHSGKWNPDAKNFVSLDKKRKNVAKLAEEKKSLAHKYFPPELTDRIDVWKGARNKIIHAPMKQDLHTEDLSAVALDGQALVKTLCSKTSLYNRALERQANKENGK